MKCSIIRRVSTDEQAKKMSLVAQHDLCMQSIKFLDKTISPFDYKRKNSPKKP
jgi:hypothetical protein